MNSSVDIGFDHRFIRGSGAAGALTLLLLHGTGGDGDSLLQLGDTLRPGTTLLSPTGNVREHGMPRFFRRLADGVFDHEDLMRRTDELAQFVRDAITAYQLDGRRVVAAGFSNGANIAASVLLKHPGLLAGAILLRPMVPFTPEQHGVLSDARDIPVFVGSGMLDTMVPQDNSAALARLLSEMGYTVTEHRETAGHELTLGDVRAAKAWMERCFPS